MSDAVPFLSPHGGSLRELWVPADAATDKKNEAAGLPHLTLNEQQQCDVELLMTGAYSPLVGFMSQSEYREVLETCRLPDGLAFALPVVLEVSNAFASDMETGARVALRDHEGVNLAILTISEIWQADGAAEAAALGVPPALAREGARYYAGGPIEGLELPVRYGFEAHYVSPADFRASDARFGQRRRFAVHTSSPLHRFQCEHAGHLATTHGFEITAHLADGGVDFDSLERMARLRSNRAAAAAGLDDARLLLLPYTTRGAGAREVLQHAIIRQNFGFDAFASYDSLEVDPTIDALLNELEIRTFQVERHGYSSESGTFAPMGSAPNQVPNPSAREIETALRRGDPIAEWVSYPSVLAALSEAHRAPNKAGLVVFFTGLSGSGKSTIARYVFGRLLEDGGRPITLLDGDVVRQHLSSELGFSKEHRNLNIQRIGYVAAEIAKGGGAAVCAPIAPYAQTRQTVREMVERNGAFIEIHVATPLDVCEARDRKGLYALARAGKIKEFTGISDPYEVPEAPTLRIDTSTMSAEDAGEQVLDALRAEGYIR